MTLPLFLLHLATRVNWEDEEGCFETIALELAEFYSDFSDYLSISNENTMDTEISKKADVLEPKKDTITNDRISVLESGNKNEIEDLIQTERKENLKSSESEMSRDFSTSEYAEMIQHLFFPAFRSVLLPPKYLVDEGIVIQIAALEQLYRVFERC